MEKKRVVIALGGNALGKDIEEQKEAVAKTAKVIVDLVQQGMELVITHGNGPQVGMIQSAMDQALLRLQALQADAAADLRGYEPGLYRHRPSKCDQV